MRTNPLNTVCPAIEIKEQVVHIPKALMRTIRLRTPSVVRIALNLLQELCHPGAEKDVTTSTGAVTAAAVLGASPHGRRQQVHPLARRGQGFGAAKPRPQVALVVRQALDRAHQVTPHAVEAVQSLHPLLSASSRPARS